MFWDFAFFLLMMKCLNVTDKRTYEHIHAYGPSCSTLIKFELVKIIFVGKISRNEYAVSCFIFLYLPLVACALWLDLVIGMLNAFTANYMQYSIILWLKMISAWFKLIMAQ